MDAFVERFCGFLRVQKRRSALQGPLNRATHALCHVYSLYMVESFLDPELSRCHVHCQDQRNEKCVQLSGREGQAIQDVMLLKTGERTVPRVFINGRCIGGGTETAAAAADGSLARLLAA